MPLNSPAAHGGSLSDQKDIHSPRDSGIGQIFFLSDFQANTTVSTPAEHALSALPLDSQRTKEKRTSVWTRFFLFWTVVVVLFFLLQFVHEQCEKIKRKFVNFATQLDVKVGMQSALVIVIVISVNLQWYFRPMIDPQQQNHILSPITRPENASCEGNPGMFSYGKWIRHWRKTQEVLQCVIFPVGVRIADKGLIRGMTSKGTLKMCARLMVGRKNMLGKFCCAVLEARRRHIHMDYPWRSNLI